MAEQTNPFDKSAQEGSRFGFVADLAFVLCFVWLVLWRAELFAADVDSVWGGGWPALILGGLVAAAFAIGLVRRRSTGFLPVVLRWGLLIACLILPAWIALSLADLRREMTMQTASEELSASAQELQSTARSPETRREAQAAEEAAKALDTLGRALKAAEERGIEVPHRDLGALGFDPAAVAALPPKTKKALEKAAGIAEVQAGKAPAPSGFSELMREFGLDNPLVQKALLGLAAATLGPLLGLSPALVEAVLAALLIDGDLSLENILQVSVALAMSTTKTGKLSAPKFKKNIKLVRQGAAVIEKIHGALEKRGVGDSEAMRTFKEVGNKKSEKEASAACNKAIAEARERRRTELNDQLRQACPELSPQEIRDRIGGS